MSHWSDVNYHMLPVAAKLEERITADMFVCISRYQLQQATERRIASSGTFRCYHLPFAQGFGVCCDRDRYSCAQLNPGLFPDLQPKAKQKTDGPPRSGWVRPPSDNEQWKSN